jgi:hypothetical protein
MTKYLLLYRAPVSATEQMSGASDRGPRAPAAPRHLIAPPDSTRLAPDAHVASLCKRPAWRGRVGRGRHPHTRRLSSRHAGRPLHRSPPAGERSGGARNGAATSPPDVANSCPSAVAGLVSWGLMVACRATPCGPQQGLPASAAGLAFARRSPGRAVSR